MGGGPTTPIIITGGGIFGDPIYVTAIWGPVW